MDNLHVTRGTMSSILANSQILLLAYMQWLLPVVCMLLRQIPKGEPQRRHKARACRLDKLARVNLHHARGEEVEATTDEESSATCTEADSGAPECIVSLLSSSSTYIFTDLELPPLGLLCHTYSTSPRSLHTHIHYEFGALLGKYISAIPRAAQWAASVISLAPASTNNSRSMSAFE